MEMINYDIRQPWEDLANGIIKQAADDYKKALRRCQFKRKKEVAQEIHSLNRWFRGDWFNMLTNIDPEYLIQRLNTEYGDDYTTEFINRTTIYEKERI